MNKNQEKVETDVKIHIDQTDLNEVLRKLERIRDLAKEANSLAGELASKELNISMKVDVE